jgi:mannose-6-phosphate isomerase-like protein (cupin superfamily)
MITFQETHTQFSYAKTQQIPGIDSASTGFMVLQPGGEKPNRNTKANTLSFVVITGKVEATIYKTSVVVGVGTQFSVPSGNQYMLVNRGKVECRVFWVCLTPGAEAEKVKEIEEVLEDVQEEVDGGEASEEQEEVESGKGQEEESQED